MTDLPQVPATTCPVCGLENATSGPGSFDICPRCGWEDDAVQREDADTWGGANVLSLRQARQAWRESIIVRAWHWDAHLVSAPRSAESDLGAREEVLRRLNQALPGIDRSDLAWPTLRRDRLYMEFDLQPAGRVKSAWVHAYGSGDAIGTLRGLSVEIGWRILDIYNHAGREPIAFLDLEERADQLWRRWLEHVSASITEQTRKAAVQGKRLIFTTLTEIRSGKLVTDFADIRDLYLG